MTAIARPVARILSIGCSCINRFQFRFFLERRPDLDPVFPRGLFDWNIASLEASLRVLRLAADGTLVRTLGDANAFHVRHDTLIFHDALPGLSFFHEDTPKALLSEPQRRQAFLDKLAHLAGPLTTASDGRTHVIWSNIQPNLPDTVENVIPWANFRLTRIRRDEARALCQRLYGEDTTFAFISTPQDMEPELRGDADVTVIDLPRGADYTGPKDLFTDIIDKALLIASP